MTAFLLHIKSLNCGKHQMSRLNSNFIAIVIYIQSVRQLTCQYTEIWYDDMQQNNGWITSGQVEFGKDSISCRSGFCTLTSYEGGLAWIRRDTDVSQYSSLQIQYDVSSRSLETGDQCRVYYSYTGSSEDDRMQIDGISPLSTDRLYYPDQEVILPDASSANTVWIWLEAYSTGDSSDYCYWDNVYLNGILSTTTQNPTKNPTENPTKYPSKNPTKNPIKNPTKNPTKNPIKNPTKTPTKNPIKNPTKTPTKYPTNNPTDSPSKYPTNIPTNPPTTDPVTSTPVPSGTPTLEYRDVRVYTETESTEIRIETELITSNDQWKSKLVMIILAAVSVCCCSFFMVSWCCYAFEKTHKIDTQTNQSDPLEAAPESVEIVHVAADVMQAPLFASLPSIPKVQHICTLGNDDANSNIADDLMRTALFGSLPSIPKVQHMCTPDNDDDLMHGALFASLPSSPNVQHICTLGNDDANSNIADDLMQTALFGSLPSSIPNIQPISTPSDDDENSNIGLWLRDTVQLPQYLYNFVHNGFDTLYMIRVIENTEQLTEIGIDKVGHQTRLISEIKKLSETQYEESAETQYEESGAQGEGELAVEKEDTQEDNQGNIAALSDNALQ